MRSLLPLFLCFGVAVSCTTKTTLTLEKAPIMNMITLKQKLFFEYPAQANVKAQKYPGSKSNSITVVAGSRATVSYEIGKIVISADSIVSGAPSGWISPLALWTGAASVLTNHNIDRALLGTTAVIAASSLMNVALAADCIDIYFNLPGYVQDSNKYTNGKRYIAFSAPKERTISTKPFKVLDGTCALGQCGGPSSAGPTGCQCDAECIKLGDCCDDFANSCEVSSTTTATTTAMTTATATAMTTTTTTPTTTTTTTTPTTTTTMISYLNEVVLATGGKGVFGYGCFFNAQALAGSGGVTLTRVTVSPWTLSTHRGGDITVWTTKVNTALTLYNSPNKIDDDPRYKDQSQWVQVGAMSNLQSDNTVVDLTTPVVVPEGETRGVYIHYSRNGLAMTKNPSPVADSQLQLVPRAAAFGDTPFERFYSAESFFAGSVSHF